MMLLTKGQEKTQCKMLHMEKQNLVLMMTKKYFKIKDHCHYTGKCRGAAHGICNLRCKIPK